MLKRADLFSAYFVDQKKTVAEAARATRFALLLGSLFADRPDLISDYVSGIELWVSNHKKGGILRGRADALFGNLIVEFERNLNDEAKRSEAEEQLRRYAAIQWNNENPSARTQYLGLASDGIRFLLFTPVAPADRTDLTPSDVELRPLETVDLEKVTPDDAYFFLDRAFLRREVLTPTGARIAEDFGLSSHAFQSARHALGDLWSEVGAKPAFAVVHETWNRYLAVVYGSAIGNPDLFLRHTYLATLAKLMAFMRLRGDKTAPTDTQLRELIAGELFKKLSLHNFLEEDFFSWLARPEALSVALATTRHLLSLLASYDLAQLSEDVLKGLYQELVDPAERAELGEFYTPDWLAHKLVRQMLDSNPHASVFDPTCGSGTFLYFTIQEKIDRLGKSAETTRHILDSVCGTDVHPLAVIVAKTNVVLALGDLLTKHRPKGTLAIPVFLADTLKLPELFFKGDTYTVPIEKQNFYIHKSLLNEMGTADSSVELQAEFARAHKNHKIERSQWEDFLKTRGFVVPEGAEDDLWDGMNTFKGFLEADRDSIWAYVVKNIFKPLFFRNRFDLVLGNPPWIVLRSLEPGYQAFVKNQTAVYGLATGQRGHLVTQMEMASLFLLRAADLYLKPGGKIGFVLPRAVFSADQHSNLRRGLYTMPHSNSTLAVRELWDLDKVRPLFRIPSCVVIGEKVSLDAKPKSGELISGLTISGKLSNKNAPLSQAESKLQQETTEWNLHVMGSRNYWATGEIGTAKAASLYKKNFRQGATIVPRSFWFVEVQEGGVLGFDPAMPPLSTDLRAIKESKKPYQDVIFSGQVEADYLFLTLLSSDLLPFGHLPFRLVTLPVEPNGNKYKVVTAQMAQARGAFHLAQWLKNAETTWKEKRGDKADRNSIYEWVNYSQKLTNQNPQPEYRVLYARSGTYMTVAVIESTPQVAEMEDQQVQTQGFIVDSTLHFAPFRSESEAHYLAAILNSPYVDELIKPMQSRGNFGPRDIYNKVLELPIPNYKADVSTHQELAKLGKTCAIKTSEWIKLTPDVARMSIGSARGKVRQYLAPELEAIDAIVTELLG